tara:strand:- start:35 stop:979 length:945 start_codon:yes stop_codon:yes gene_type:complete
MKQAIVTGATGFIGSSFVQFLLNKNIDVLSLGRKPLNSINLKRKNKIINSKYLNIDMKNIDSLGEKIKKLGWKVGDDCVFFNLAWGGKSQLSDLNIKYQLNNVKWSVLALNTAHLIGCKKFIQVGTMEEAFTHKYLELDHNKNNEFNRHVVYSVAKISSKYALQLKAGQLGIDFIYVLHSHVMGPDDDKDSFLQETLKKLVKGQKLIFSSGNQYFDVISSEDCSLGYYLICKNGIAGSEYWVGSGNPRRLREYVEIMYKLFPSKRKLEFGKLPYNDIILKKKDFSIDLLFKHTGYKTTMTYEETVKKLYESIFL